MWLDKYLADSPSSIRILFSKILYLLFGFLVGTKDYFLGIVRWFLGVGYNALPYTVIPYAFFYATLETERIARVLEDFLLQGVFILIHSNDISFDFYYEYA